MSFCAVVENSSERGGRREVDGSGGMAGQLTTSGAGGDEGCDMLVQAPSSVASSAGSISSACLEAFVFMVDFSH